MLTRANRVTSGSEYRKAVRRGRRVSGEATIAYVLAPPVSSVNEDAPPRFGFIVARNVGGAVVRNRVRRQLKAATFTAMADAAPGVDVVFRALPAAASAGWQVLSADVQRAVARSSR